MMKLALGSNKVLRYMDIYIYIYISIYTYVYPRVGFERLKLSKDDLNHFLLVMMPRISPRIII